MPIQFIDNQPVRFNSAKFDDQACINKDDSAYAILVAVDDPVCVEVKRGCEGNISCLNTELGNEEAADPDFDNGCGVDWTCGTDWTMAGGQAIYTADGNDGALSQAIASFDVGEQYCIDVDVDSNDTGYAIDIYIGGRRIGQIPSTATGSQKVYGEVGPTTDIVIRLTNDYSSAAAGTLVLNSVSVKQIAFCNQFVTSEREYVVNGDFSTLPTEWEIGTGWSWSGTDFTHATPASTASLAQNIPTIGHRDAILFEFTMINRTAGSVSLYYGDTFIATQSADGTNSTTYAAYGLGDDDLELRPAGNFDGDIDDVSATETRSGWNFDPVSGFCHAVGWANPFYSTEPLTVGVSYRITFEITMSAGSVYVECGGQVIGTFTQSGVYSFYFEALTTDQYKFTPSSDFDGCIGPNIPICTADDDIQFRLIHSDGTGATDWHTPSSSQDAVRYKGDYVAWCITTMSDALSGGVGVALPYGCYYVQVQIPGVEIWTSDNIIDYQASWNCTKRIRAWSDGQALGFEFGDNGDFFLLVQRFRTLYMTPVYPNEGVDYEFSTGTTRRIEAKRYKNYEMQFDRMDEYAHDTVSVMIMCDDFEVDGVEYIVPFKDYEPEWVERGKRNLAMSTIEIQKRIEGVLFNRNC